MQIDQITQSTFFLSARRARTVLEDFSLLRSRRLLLRAESQQHVFDCLRNLGCLVDWWPDAISVQPLAPGLHGSGDCALLQLCYATVLLRVLHFSPKHRLILAIDLPQSLVVLDLRVRILGTSAQLELSFEAPELPSEVLGPQAAQQSPQKLDQGAATQAWLERLADAACAGLATHLDHIATASTLRN